MEAAVTTNPRVPVNPASDSTLQKSRFTDQANTPLPDLRATPLSQGDRPGVWKRWLNHVEVSFFVLLCAVIGMLLVFLPWSLQWTDNPLLWTHPQLRVFLGYGFVRGLCSGLGILDLWIGIREAAHYSEKLGILK